MNPESIRPKDAERDDREGEHGQHYFYEGKRLMAIFAGLRIEPDGG